MVKPKKGSVLAAFSLAASVGFNMAASIAVGVFAGRMIDYWLDTGPWFTAAGILAGMLAGLWGVYKQVMSAADERND